MDLSFFPSVNQKDKEFIEEYQKLMIENNGDENVVNAVVKYLFKDLNHQNLIKTLYLGIKTKLFYDSYNKSIAIPFKINIDFLKFAKDKNINLGIPVLQKSFFAPSKFNSFKIRDNYVLSSGIDGIIRIWTFDETKNEFFFFGEYGERLNKEVNFDLVGEFLFYSNGKTLNIYHIYTRKLIKTESFNGNIEDLNAEFNNIVVYIDGIAQKFIFKDNSLSGTISSKYTSLNKKMSVGVIKNKKQVFIKDNQICFIDFSSERSLTPAVEFSIFKELRAPSINLHLSPNNKFIIGKTNSISYMFDTDMKIIKEFKELKNISAISTYNSGSGLMYVTEDGVMKLYNLINSISLTTEKNIKASASSLYHGNNTKIIAVGGSDGFIRLFDENLNQLKNWKVHNNLISGISFSKNEKLIVTASFDKFIKITDLNGNQTASWTAHNEKITSLSLTPNGLGILTGSYKELKLWDFEGNCLRVWNFNDFVNSISFSNGGNLLLTIGMSSSIYSFKENETLKTTDFNNLSMMSNNEIFGIKKFDGYIQIFYKNGKVICFDSNGNEKFSFNIKATDLSITNLQQPKIKLHFINDDFIMEKDGAFFGSKNWKNYLYFFENNKICLSTEGFDYYYDLITNRNLFYEI